MIFNAFFNLNAGVGDWTVAFIPGIELARIGGYGRGYAICLTFCWLCFEITLQWTKR